MTSMRHFRHERKNNWPTSFRVRRRDILVDHSATDIGACFLSCLQGVLTGRKTKAQQLNFQSLTGGHAVLLIVELELRGYSDILLFLAVITISPGINSLYTSLAFGCRSLEKGPSLGHWGCTCGGSRNGIASREEMKSKRHRVQHTFAS